MKSWHILGGVLIVATALAIGFHLTRPTQVEFTFTNSATQPLRSVQLQSDREISQPVAFGPGEYKAVSIRVEGESAVSTVVTFENGRLLQTAGIYVEPGYRISATIQDHDVHFEYVSFL